MELTHDVFVSVSLAVSGPLELDQDGRDAAGQALAMVVDNAHSVTRSDGATADVVHRFIGVHPAGAEVVMVIRGADVRFAASAVEALIAYALEGSKILDGWRITGATAEPITSDAPIE
jgi:hypothetical protein